MDEFTITELAYKNGYEQGYAQGKKDALKWISVEERLPENNQDVLCWKQYIKHWQPRKDGE